MKISGKLSHQLFLLILVVFAITFLMLGIILPQVVVPITEKNIYNYLKEPLEFIQSDIDKNLGDSEIAYIYKFGETSAYSENLHDLMKFKNVGEILSYIKDDYGRFVYRNQVYYYYTLHNDNVTKIAVTNDSYILKTKTDILNSILPVVLITFLIIAFLLILWGSIIVKKIEKLKQKIDHIDDDTYDHSLSFAVEDEIKSLEMAIEDMRISLKDQEEYRNQMYQNISHDFKTPLTVIKSYIEAVDDKVEDEATALNVIREQTSKLEQKVHSLLYLNKLDYLKNSKNIKLVPVDMENIIKTEVEKFKFHRKELNFIVECDKKSQFVGTVENWETILDNLLSNFIRYATTTIKITAKQNKLILYNDGDNINSDFLDGIFTPFRKGIKGEFGLGLSIVKKTLNLMNYDIVIVNEKVGVSFIITKGTHK